MRLLRVAAVWLFIGIQLFIAVARADEPPWGHLSGRFIFDGTPPEPRTIPVTSDKKAFGPSVTDESLLVHPKNRGLANVVVYICPKKGETLPVHPSYAKTAEAKIKLAMRNGRFEPHVLLLRTSQTMVQDNDDPVAHHANISFRANAPMRPTLPTGRSVELRYTKAERVPLLAQCNIHPWMSAYVVLRDEPYMAKTDESGKFLIENVPAGTHSFQFWHERCGYLREIRFVSHGEESKTDKHGKADLRIRAGNNDLGEIKLDAKLFQR